MHTLTHIIDRYPQLSMLAFLSLPLAVLAIITFAQSLRMGPVR
jgi:hypothetical protein